MPKPDPAVDPAVEAAFTRAENIGAVLYYLRFAAEDGLVFNMTTGREAFDAFARLLGEDPAALWERTGTP